MGAQKFRPEVKNGNNSDALGSGGAHAVTIGDVPSLEWFQVDPNGKSRFKEGLNSK